MWCHANTRGSSRPHRLGAVLMAAGPQVNSALPALMDLIKFDGVYCRVGIPPATDQVRRGQATSMRARTIKNTSFDE